MQNEIEEGQNPEFRSVSGDRPHVRSAARAATTATEQTRPADLPFPKRKRLRSADRKAQIVQVTLQLVAQYGLHGVSMSRIAEAVGVSNAALYRHFP
ncbi:MAG: helix-turn-helix transcriptional regulator, partial [Thermoleophilia bacterium]|nr:helix-turn-helix transcriptional regulator [Thermoleophilia bacterium]